MGDQKPPARETFAQHIARAAGVRRPRVLSKRGKAAVLKLLADIVETAEADFEFCVAFQFLLARAQRGYSAGAPEAK
jgi:hypothetical protein